MLAKNKKLLEIVTVLKREEEIHKRVETELAQRSQKAQNQINKLSDNLKVIENEKEQLRIEHAKSEQNLSIVKDTNLAEDILEMEKSLNSLHKGAIDYKRVAYKITQKREKLVAKNGKFDARMKQLQKNQNICLSLMLEELDKFEENPESFQLGPSNNDEMIDLSNLYHSK